MAECEDAPRPDPTLRTDDACPSIISVSRRTDIPSFYAEWFVKRVAEGYADVRHPFTPALVKRVSLRAEDVRALVFWTRDFTPLRNIFHSELERRHFYMVLWTLTGYPSILEPMAQPVRSVLDSFRETAKSTRRGLLVWRYDPIVINDIFDAEWHVDNFSRLASALEGSTDRVIISVMTPYRSVMKRFRERNVEYDESLYERGGERLSFLSRLREIAGEHGMKMQACCHGGALLPYGIADGACIDAAYMAERLGLEAGAERDPGQRKTCLCAKSIDIGAYECCPRNCLYCYATKSPEKSRIYWKSFDQSGELLR